MYSIRTIVVPYDFSQHSMAALDVANGLATRLGASLHLLHVIAVLPYGYAHDLDMESTVGGLSTRDRNGFRRELARVAAECGAPSNRIHIHVVEAPNIANAIDSEAERLGADLIAMGTHGRTGLTHLLMGSIAEATTRRAPCPVLTVPYRAEDRLHATRRRASMHPASGSF
jgi:universal stress protein A